MWTADISVMNVCIWCSPDPKASTGDVSGNAGAPQASSGGMAPVGPTLSGLFAAGFPTLRPIGQRDFAGKTQGWCKMSYSCAYMCVCVMIQ